MGGPPEDARQTSSRECSSETVEVSFVLKMLPKQAHDFSPQNLGAEMRCEATVERVRRFVANKVAMMSGAGPVPVDIGHATAEWYGEWCGE